MPFSSRAVFRGLLGLSFALAVTHCGPDTRRGPDLEPPVEETIGAAGGQIAGPGGTSLTVPAGATGSDTVITVSQIADAAPPTGSALVAQPIRLEPSGKTFDQPVEITITLSSAGLPAGASTDDVVVLRAPNGTTDFTVLPTVVSGPNTVTAITEHFSDFVAVVATTDAGIRTDNPCDLDDVCDTADGESETTCAHDCGLNFSGGQVICGDGVCSGAETCPTCPWDCACSTPCQVDNGGCAPAATCAASSGSVDCTCPSGTNDVTGLGTVCELTGSCAASSCQNGGTCVDVGAGFECTCAPGFVGVQCETAFDPCTTASCQNGGTCVAYGGTSFGCDCVNGYAGASCELPPSGPCASAPCGANGTCTETGAATFACQCDVGVTGTLCDADLDECATNADDCDANATCENLVPGFQCTCNAGFSGDGRTCTANPVGFCGDGMVDAGEDCDDGNSTGADGCTRGCVAEAGFTCPVSGGPCSDVDECLAAPCGANAVCTNGVGSYSCACDAFSWGDGVVCSPVTTCQPGQYIQTFATQTTDAVCATCPVGTFSVSTDAVFCAAWNDCAPGTYEFSPPDTMNGRYCPACPPGTYSTAVNAPTCLAWTPCGPGFVEATPGTSTSDAVCADANECALGTDDCDVSAICTNTVGGFTCACAPGYTGPGNLCIPAQYLPVTSGRLAHYMADVGLLTDPSGRVTQWNDQTSNGNHLVPDGLGPMASTWGPDAQPVVAFTGLEGLVSVVPMTLPAIGTVFVAMQYQTPSLWGAIAHHGDRDYDWSIEQAGFGTANELQFQTENDLSGLRLGFMPGDTVVLGAEFAPGSRTFFSTSDLGLTSQSGGGMMLNTLTQQLLHVGRSDNSEQSNARIAEIIYYDRALSVDERNAVLGYLRGRWPIGPKGLVHCWGGENDGVDAVSGYDATVTAGVTYAPSVAGNGFVCDGANGGLGTNLYGTRPIGLTPDQPFTFDLWVNVAQQVGDGQILDRQVTGTGSTTVGLQYTASGTFQWFLRDEFGNVAQPTAAAASTNTWHHVAVVRDGSNVTAYLDGAPVGTAPDTLTVMVWEAPRLCGFNDAGLTSYVNGGVDTLRIWNRALSPAQVAALHAGPAAGCAANP